MIYILLALAGIMNALMDLSSENLFPYRWMNKGESWKNKYKLAKYPVVSWLLENSLVFLSDFWHLAQFLENTILLIAIIISPITTLNIVITFILYKLIYTTCFFIVYKQYKKHSLHRRTKES